MAITRRFGAVAVVAAGIFSLGISGCSGKSGDSAKGDKSAKDTTTAASSSAASMSAADLQKSLTGRISTATPVQSITCSAGLTGEVGKTDSCEAVIDDTTSVMVNVTVTSVNGNNIDYDFAPSMTKGQLEKAFAAAVSAQVTCDGGLDGKVGSNTKCQVTKDGSTDDTTVSVSKVQGLFMSLSTSGS